MPLGKHRKYGVPLAMLVAIIFYAIIMPQYGYDANELFALNATLNVTCH